MAIKPDKIEKLLDDIITGAQGRVEVAVMKLEREILKLVDEYNDGQNVGGRLKAALAFQKQATKDFELLFNSQLSPLIDFPALTALVSEVYGIDLSSPSTNALKAAASTTLEGYASISAETLTQVNQTVLDYAIAGRTKQEMRDAIQGIITGTKDAIGRDMSRYAKTFTQDAIMKFHNTANLLLAEQAGITLFQYFGTVIETTRQFCRDHIGEIRTRAEWEEIGQQNWAGKSPGGIMLTVGGYGCRHHFVGVLKK